MMLISLRMARKLQLRLVVRQITVVLLFSGFLAIPEINGYHILSKSALAAGIGVVLANIILLIPKITNRWHYTFDEKGIHLVMGSSSFASSRLLFNWQHAFLASISFSLHHWCGLPSIEFVSGKGNKIIMVYEPEEQNKVLQEIIPLLEKYQF